MNEEEKKAIEKILKEIIDNYEKYYAGSEEILPVISEDYRMTKIILNLIDKQQDRINKAIERLETRPYTAYTLYGDILYESDEIIKILKGEDNE